MSQPLLIQSGRVHDGERFIGVADVLVADGHVVAVGGSVPQGGSGAAETIDAAGCVVSPGFVELHSMVQRLEDLDGNDAVNLTAQGITTCLIGNCGQSGRVDGPDAFARGNDLLDRARVGVNVARLVGHNSLRAFAVPEPTRPSTPEEVARMTGALERAINGGAVGMSTGLMYSPGMFADRSEIEALCAVVGRRGKLYTSHMRDEGDALEEAVTEALDAAAAGGARLIISHLKSVGVRNRGKTDRVVPLIEDRRRRQEVFITYYPYAATSTVLQIVLPPSVLQAVGGDAARLSPRDADRDLTEWEGKQNLCPRGWADVQIVSSTVADAVGKSVLDLAGGDPHGGYDVVIDLLRRDPGARATFHDIASEDELMRLADLPYAMPVSDGYVYPTGSRAATHPRNYGAFARMVRHFFTRDLEGFLRRSTSLPAEVARLGRRGRLLPGWPADVAVFRPERVRDAADYARPWLLAEGVSHTIVNGRVAFRDGRATGELAGRRLA